jgi:hypothetical protein
VCAESWFHLAKDSDNEFTITLSDEL